MSPLSDGTKVTEIAIIGAGGFGREVLQYCEDASLNGWPFRVVGFVDDSLMSDGELSTPLPILGTIADLKDIALDRFIIAIGDPFTRDEMAKAVGRSGGTLVTLVHPNAYVARSATLGEGTILCPFALVAVDAVVGGNVVLNVYASVGHDSLIGDASVLSPYCAVTGEVTVGESSFLGAHVTVAPGVTLGSRCKVTAGSTVMHHAPAGSLLVGSPARGRVMFSVD